MKYKLHLGESLLSLDTKGGEAKGPLGTTPIPPLKMRVLVPSLACSL